VLSCQAAMALGTLMGGWRIVRTMGLRITKLTPMQGFCAETGGAATLFIATFLGVPVSTTHTITGAIVGVGAARRVSAVRWNVASSIVYAWVITIPASAIVAAVSCARRGSTSIETRPSTPPLVGRGPSTPAPLFLGGRASGCRVPV